MTNMKSQIKISNALRQDANLHYHQGIIEYFTIEIQIAITKIGDPETLGPLPRAVAERELTSLIKHCLLLTGKDLQDYTERLIHEQRNTSFGI